MGRPTTFWKRYLITSALWIAGVTLLVWAIAAYSFGETLRAYYVAETLPEFGLTASYPADLSEAFVVKRRIQKHFLDRHIYLPIDDIVVETADETVNASDRLTFLMRKACGQAKLYIWLPLNYKLPAKGRFTSSWCWKAQLKSKDSTAS